MPKLNFSIQTIAHLFLSPHPTKAQQIFLLRWLRFSLSAHLCKPFCSLFCLARENENLSSKATLDRVAQKKSSLTPATPAGWGSREAVPNSARRSWAYSRSVGWPGRIVFPTVFARFEQQVCWESWEFARSHRRRSDSLGSWDWIRSLGWELVSKKRKRRSIGKDRSTGSCVSNFAQTEQKMERRKDVMLNDILVWEKCQEVTAGARTNGKLKIRQMSEDQTKCLPKRIDRSWALCKAKKV